jgi:hypothetical protein
MISEVNVTAHRNFRFLPEGHKIFEVRPDGYMTVSRDQTAGRIHSTKMDNSSIERVEEFKYLEQL